MQLIRPYFNKALRSATYIFLLMIVGYLLLEWENKVKFINFIMRKNTVLETKVEDLENKYVAEEVVCEKKQNETLCNLDGVVLKCDNYEYSPTTRNPNCTEDTCLVESIYGFEGYGKLTGYYSNIKVKEAFSESDCPGFIVTGGTLELINRAKEMGHITVDEEGRDVLVLSVSEKIELKDSDVVLLTESSPEKNVELSILKVTPPQKGVGSCYTDYAVLNVRPLE